jgi:hypothetical protein
VSTLVAIVHDSSLRANVSLGARVVGARQGEHRTASEYEHSNTPN